MNSACPRMVRRLLTAMSLFGVAMMFELPRQFVIGPRSDGVPLCLWSDLIIAEARNEPTITSALVEMSYVLRTNSDNLNSPRARTRLSEGMMSPGTVPLLIELADSDDVAVRRYCLHVLAYGTHDAADKVLPLMQRRLDDEDAECRHRAAHGLWRFAKDRKAIEVLLTLTESENANIRSFAIHSLGPAGPEVPELFDHLATLVDHKDAYTRMCAMGTMANFGMRGVPALKRGLCDANKEIRRCAFWAALRLKQDAVDLLPELRALRCDPVALIAQEANAKLPQLEREICAKAK